MALVAIAELARHRLPLCRASAWHVGMARRHFCRLALSLRKHQVDLHHGTYPRATCGTEGVGGNRSCRGSQVSSLISKRKSKPKSPTVGAAQHASDQSRQLMERAVSKADQLAQEADEARTAAAVACTNFTRCKQVWQGTVAAFAGEVVPQAPVVVNV